MLRSTWVVLAFVSLGLWASLVPQITYPEASSGEPSSDVLTVWPGWGVQQDLGQLGGVVGDFVIWMASEADADPRLTVIESLLDAETRGVLRHTTSYVTPAHVPVARTLRFPSYVVPEGQRLTLQLQVADHEKYAVKYRLARQQAAYENVRLNGVANAGNGPLAFVHQATSSGLRAALHSVPHARMRMILALVVSGLAVLAHPRVAGIMWRASEAAKRLTQKAPVWGRLPGGPIDRPESGGAASALGRASASPWYPWLVAVIPILQFLASNPLHYVLSDAVIPVIVALLVMSVAMAGLRLMLNGWHRAAAVSTAVVVVLFAYGHAERALGGRLDEQVLFAAAVVLAAAAVVLTIRAPRQVAQSAPVLNISAGVLLLFQATSLAGTAWTDFTNASPPDPLKTNAAASHLFNQTPDTAVLNRPDIYYLILDGYARHDALGDFDNSDFLMDLERRGFFVAVDATSNYMFSMQSLASSLNMAYLDDLEHRVPKSQSDFSHLVQNNALVEILKNLGYTYVHLESGWSITNESPHADIAVRFTPSGVVESIADKKTGHFLDMRTMHEEVVNGTFARQLLKTTALRVMIGNLLSPASSDRYNWWAPERALLMFDYLSKPNKNASPKFVFSHIVKPHKPATFDRHGNMFLSKGGDVGFSDSHDPSVPDAYIGQLIYTNTLVLQTIDGILENSKEPPIIVIAGDHGRTGEFPRHPILAAFHLPSGGETGLYPSISSVNHFRHILRYYFGIGVSLVKDRNVSHDMKQFDFSRLEGETSG